MEEMEEKGVIEDCKDGNGITLRTVSILGFIVVLLIFSVIGVVSALRGDMDNSTESPLERGAYAPHCGP